MTLSAPRWTLRRRLIAGVVGFIWLCIAGVFLVGLTNTQPTEISYGTDEAAVTLRSDKSIAIAFLQCVHFSWDAENIALLDTIVVDYIPTIQPSIGDKQACHSEDARVIAAFDENDPKYIYPQITWINPAALLFIGIASLVAATLLWQPTWLGSLGPTSTHLIFVPILIIVVLLTQVVDPLGITLLLIPAQLLLIVISIPALALMYLFRYQPGKLYVAACALMLCATVSLAAYHLFTVPGMINQDERYYASIAATGSAGSGLYPYIQNYPPMPVMGGIGHSAWLYVAAYRVFGPTIWGLRLIVLIVYLLGILAMFLLFRRWYGSATAWLAVAIIPTTYLYVLTHSVRMDFMAITWCWWGLLIVDTARRKGRWSWHLAAGLFMGLGLQAHIDTTITTIACGILYLFDYGSEVRQAKRFVWPQAVVAYSIGALMGLGVFVVFNILPNPDAFMRTAGSAARLTVVSVEENLSMPARLLRSFLALDAFASMAVKRVLYLFQYVPTVDLIIALIAFVTLITRRRSPADRAALVLFIGAMAAGFFIINGPGLHYNSHILPITTLCLPAFFTHGYLRRGPFLINWKDIGLPLILVLLALIFPLYLPISFVSSGTTAYDRAVAQSYDPEIAYIHQHVSRECILLGSGWLYQIKFMDYPRYNAYELDGGLGRLYYGLAKGDDIWPLLNPDIIFGHRDAEFSETLQAYIQDRNYQEIAPNIWQKTNESLTSGCVIN
jgi:hypothetical protein